MICIESITSLCWGGSPQLLFLVYVWLSCRAVSAVICIESITSLCWGGSSRAVISGVCLALLQGSCSRKISCFNLGGGGN